MIFAVTKWPIAIWSRGAHQFWGASGEHDFADAAFTAVVNKRAGGMGPISGRKAFQGPMEDGAKLLNTIQDVPCQRGHYRLTGGYFGDAW